MKSSSKFPAAGVFEEFRKLLGEREQELTRSLTPRNHLAQLYSTQGGIFGESPSLKRNASDRIPSPDPLTADLCKHPAYLWLSRSDNYQRALSIFRERRLRETDQAQAALGEVQFIERILTWLGFSIHTAATGWRPKSVSSEQRQRTLKRAARLLDDIDSGVGLADYAENAQLKHLLAAFCAELSGRKRRDYAGHALQRTVLSTLALSLLGSQGLKAADVVEIVCEAAPLYGFDVSSRSVQRYVRDARRKSAEAMDKALGRRQRAQLARTLEKRTAKRPATGT